MANGRTTHACVDVRGVLTWPKRMLSGMFRRDGRSLTPDQAREWTGLDLGKAIVMAREWVKAREGQAPV